MKRLDNASIILLVLAVVAFASGCGDDELNQPASLQTPRSFTVARGPVCLTSTAPFGGAVRPVLSQCTGDEDQVGVPAIGLIANQTGDTVAVVDMSQDMGGSPPRQPRLVDLDPATPGVTHIPVGESPVDVAAGRGTTAYSVNQASASLSVINLTVLKALQDDIVFDEAPKKAVVTPPAADADAGTPGKLVVALSNPSRLWIADEVQCDFPEGASEGIERDNEPADTGCTEVPTQTDGAEFDLPGSVSDMAVGPHGDRVYVIYSDTHFASVIAVSDAALDDFDEGCLDGGQAPCEAGRIGLSYDCSNGVDDDDDGLVDREDPQCFGARGSESVDGIGRNPTDECANGIDDDDDGEVDRDDPDCLVSGGSEAAPIVEDVTLACMDERDNDDDGDVDYPDDDACYGEVGRTETGSVALGLTAVSIDPAGKFLYVADRANNQVLVADAERLDLVDAFDASGRDRTPFAQRIGVPVPPSPMAVQGTVDRTVIWRDPQNETSHAIVRYTYGAYVATDGGFAYNINAMTTQCEIEAGNGAIPNRVDLSRDPGALDGTAEQNCLQIPAFPLSYDVEACQALDTCEACLRAGGDCAELCADAAQNRQDCLGDRVETVDDVQLAFTANFELQDAESRESRVRGLGTCESPADLVDAIRETAEGPADVSCTSPLRPQPVAPGTAEADIDRGEFERASLLQESTAALLAGDELSDAQQNALTEILGDAVDPSEVIAQSLLSTDDQAIIDEAWSVTWEGVLPDTRRDGGIVAEAGGELEVVGLDLCEAGVREGDRLTLLSSPAAPGDELPSECQVFVDDEDARDFLTWEVEEVQPDRLVLSVIEDEAEGENFVDELPTRGCFATGVRYEIRPNDEWIVVGDRTGYLSDRQSVLGTCQPVYGADHPRYDARVSTGELFEGPYLSFVMREGIVPAERGAEEELSYRFAVEQNFTPTGFRTTAILPTQLLVETGLPAGTWVIVPDAASNFVYFRALRLGDEGDFLLQ